MSSVDPNLRAVLPLDGTSLAIVIVSITCGVISALVVGLRIYVRFGEHVFGWDDGLMLGGLTVFMIEVVLACLGAYAGLGALDSRLNAYLSIQSKKYLMIWMMLYVGSLVLIKASICMTMLRVGSPIKSLRVCVYLLLTFIIGTFLATIIGILCLCRPVEANWNTGLVLEGKATCTTMDVMIGLSYFSTASSIATDLACAVLPGVIVWNMQMPRKTKIWVCVLLSFGSLACISTIIRTPYIRYYLDPTNNLVYHVGNIVLWSNIESAIGLVAGSMPSLRRLVSRSKTGTDTEHSGSGLPGRAAAPVGLVTFGSAPAGTRRGANRSRSFKNPTDTGHSVTTIRGDGGDWRRLKDESFYNDKVITDHTYEVEMTPGPDHKSTGGSSRDSIIKRTI